MKPIYGKSIQYWAILLCLLLVVFGVVGGTLAYLFSITDELPNTFVPASVTCRVEETFAPDSGVKENVCIRNTGNIAAYIRVVVVVNWVKDGEEGIVHADAPQLGVDYTVQWAQSGWMQGTDGYWYYPESVQPDAVTEDLITKVQCIGEGPEGYRLGVQILASAIQAQPADAVMDAWNVTVTDAGIRPKTTP